jgi:Rad3-related DNA helicase
VNKSIIVKVSVRGIIEYALKSGSLDDRFMSKGRAIYGTLAHVKLQKDNEKIYDNYETEVNLRCQFNIKNIILEVEGRADGIIKENNSVIIEEIKSTYKDLIYIQDDYNDIHWAQGKFYGYIYCHNNGLQKISIRLSYFNLNTGEVKSFEKEYKYQDLNLYVNKLIDKYIKVVQIRQEFKVKRDISIKNMKFPFNTYRKGQKELAITCYNSIKQKGKLFVQAPTGIGKTISTIFPSIKSLAEGNGDRIIYLTSKTITRIVAEDAYLRLLNNGLRFKIVSITAKEKMCLNDELKCNPVDCIYAREYYTKINEIINNIIVKEDFFSRDIIIKYAKEFEVCPFELSLDISEWTDCIICDYNYAFDPRVRLKRVFMENNKNILLVDEAHNLVSRAREMYSGEILKSSVMAVNKILKGRVPNLYNISKLINKEMINIRRDLEEKNIMFLYGNNEYKDLNKYIRMFIGEADEYLIKSKNTDGYEEVLEFYYSCRNFITLSELYSNQYTTILRKEKNEFIIKIFCIDPSKNIAEVLENSYSSIFFSATLSPMKYYIDLLGGDDSSYRVRLQSPFNSKNLEVFAYGLDMRYVNRDQNINKLCYIINDFVEMEKGNYLIFLPSFQYLKSVYEVYVEKFGDKNTIIQKENFTEKEKEKFLNEFKENSNTIGFSVVGGMFSEGVDLPGKRLIGAVIIGVGFPKVSLENDIIKEYFDIDGFNYAYTYPGINKVLQSAGRVIRSESDKGRILLVDSRYFNNKYKNMLPKEWNIKNYM